MLPLIRIHTFLAAALAILALACSGCASEPGIIFPQVAGAPCWPPPPDQARITYVGQLRTDQDLKPGLNSFDVLGQAIFGKSDAHSMLSPLAICTDNEDRLFVADSNAQLVHVFNLKDRKYTQWTPGKKQQPFAQPVAAAWDPIHQHLLVSDSVAAAVLVFDTHGNYLGHLGGDEADKTLQRPVGVAVDSTPAHAGRVLVADVKLHEIIVFSPEGKLQGHIGGRGDAPGKFNYPTYLAIDSTGLIYVSDSLNFRIQQFDADFRFIRQIGKKGDFPGYFAEPKGIATDSQGHLYVVDAQFENVQVYNSQGQVLMDFGEEGAAPGQFWLPVGLCVTSSSGVAGGTVGANRIYVADSYNRRIQVFDYRGVPEDVP